MILMVPILEVVLLQGLPYLMEYSMALQILVV